MTGPLSGVKILDLSAVVSGPMAAMVLADQGAEVIKVEPPHYGDGVRYLGASRGGVSAIFSMINRNKRSIAVDLKHPRGRDIILKLAEDCDVLLQNFRPGKMDKLGLGYDMAHAVNPTLIYTSISGVGDEGPMAGQKVYDYVIQGLSGAIEAQSDSHEPNTVRTIIYDKVTALTAAQGITAALFAREKTGVGQHLKLSMLDAGIYFNWPDLMWNYSFEEDSFDGQPTQYAGDLADLYEINRTSDGAIVSNRLGVDCSNHTTADVCQWLSDNEVPVAPVNSRAQVLSDPQVKASGSLLRCHHPLAGGLIQARSPMSFSDSKTEAPKPAPGLGEHTQNVLAEMGLSEEEIGSLFAEGVIG